MERKEFFVSKEHLEYVLSNQELTNSFSEEYETTETPSVFYLNLKYTGEIYLPITIFQNKLTPFQAIIKYLKEQLNLSNKKISRILNRDIKAIWAAYQLGKDKSLLFKETPISIPLSIFKDKKLSILEALVRFLKNQDMNYAEIARLLNRDQRTIWTVYLRAKNKLGLVENEKE
jgi:DNA-binding CsgD family transcriptional regulator